MPEVDHFGHDLAVAVKNKKSVLVVGLDPQLRYMPRLLMQEVAGRYGRSFEAVGRLFFAFNRQIIDAICGYAVAVKPQMAFYECYGHWGMWAFEQTVAYARRKGLLVITDAKRGDGGDTADAYADGHIGEIPFWGRRNISDLTRRASPIRTNCITVHPHIGHDCVMRFVKPVNEYGTGIFVVDKTSFKPNSRVEEIVSESGLKVWEHIAQMVEEWGRDTAGPIGGYRSVGVVMGATKPEDAPTMRKYLPNSWFLVPGYGRQGGAADEAVAGANDDGLGCVVNSSRGINFAYLDGPYKCKPELFAEAAGNAAQDAVTELNAALKRAGKFNL